MDEVARIARERRPKLLLAGWSAYPRVLDFERFREIADEVGALLMVDMAHFAGLVAAGMHPNPVPYADVVTTHVHKTLGGARGGLILCREEYRKKINSAVFPGQQGGPLEHVIAGKAVALKIAASAQFRERQERTVAGAKAVAAELLDAGTGVNVLTGGTDVHLVLVDLRDSELDGMQAEDRLHEIGITVNRNAVPFDPRPPAVSSGLRVGASGARHPRRPGRRLRRDRPHHRRRAAARVRRREGRAGRARHRDRRPLPALRAPERPAPPSDRGRGRAPARPAILSGAMKDDALLGFLVALVVAALLTPLVARLARRIGAVDAVKERGLAREATPLLGGLAIFAGVLVAALLFLPMTDATKGDPRRRGADHRRRRARRLARARRRRRSSPARSRPRWCWCSPASASTS